MEKIKIQKSIIYIRIVYFASLLSLGVTYKYLETGFPNNFENTMMNFLPSAIGSAIGLGFIPVIIAIIRKLRKKSPTIGIYVVYIVISIVFAFLSFSNLSFEKSYENSNNKNNSSKNSSLNANGYTFASSEYSVKFKEKTEIVSSSLPLGDNFYKGKTAELFNPVENSFCRAEFFEVGSKFSDRVNEEFAYKFLNEYCSYDGFTFPVFKYDENDLGKTGSIRAYKTLTDENGNEFKFTFYSITYFGLTSVMALYVGSKSTTYPTQSILKFLNSISKISK